MLNAISVPLNRLFTNEGQIEGLPANPRLIKDESFNKLKKSIQDDPEMLSVREIVAYEHDGKLIIIMGNMRYRALLDLGYKEAVVKILPKETTVEKLKSMLIKDNVPYGSWDYDMLSAEWDEAELDDWGVDVWQTEDNGEGEGSGGDSENPYTQKIEAPIYEPSGDKPLLEEVYDTEKYDQLIAEINASNLPENEKEFLKLTATRHIVFNYEKIANYYAHSDKHTQNLMENSALVIIDFDKAIENGYVQVSEAISNQYQEDYADDSE